MVNALIFPVSQRGRTNARRGIQIAPSAFLVGGSMQANQELDFSRGQDWWDRYFMGLAKHAATASRDPSTQSGAVIARPDKTISSLGYNGFPRGVPDDPALYADRATKYDLVVHSEMNAIANAGERVHGFTLYQYPFIPCKHCCIHVIQHGIKRVVAPPIDTHPERWRDAMQWSLDLFKVAGVEFKAYVGPH